MLLDLRGKKALVTGIANNKSIAWGIAQQLHAAGCELGVTYLPDEKGRFEGKVRDLTAPLAPSLFEPLNVQDPAQIEAVFNRVKEQVALPLKLLLFVLVDGWQLVVRSLVQSFAT